MREASMPCQRAKDAHAVRLPSKRGSQPRAGQCMLAIHGMSEACVPVRHGGQKAMVVSRGREGYSSKNQAGQWGLEEGDGRRRTVV